VADILEDIKRLVPGTVIPKPEGGDFRIKRWGGKRRGELALIYTIPNKNTPTKPFEKGVTSKEWTQAFDRLMKEGEFSRGWFNMYMTACAKEGGCNFTSIGGVFEFLGYAAY
jgi:hypothetical protein